MPSGAAYPRRGAKRSRQVAFPRKATSYPRYRRDIPRNRFSNPMTHSAMTRVHYFTRTTHKQALTQAPTTANTAGAMFFTLNDLYSPSDFTNLFEEYKIMKIVLNFEPIFTEAPEGSGATPLYMPYISMCNDYNDATFTDTSTTGRNTVRAWSGSKSYPMFGRPWTWALYPHVSLDTLVTAASGYTTMPGSSTWISSTTIGVKYFGVKYWYDNANLDDNLAFVNVYATFHMAFRTTH